MHIFPVIPCTMSKSTNGMPFVKDDDIYWALENDADNIFDEFLDPYGLSSLFLDELKTPSHAVPWAFVCLDKEYRLAGHVTSKRPDGALIKFSPYSCIPNPVAEDFVPSVGVLVVPTKESLSLGSQRSPVFLAAWEVLKDYSEDQHWLVILDPLDEASIEEFLAGDDELWRSTRP